MSLPDDGLVCWRNTIAVVVCNWVLNHVATPAYRLRTDLAIKAGLEVLYEHDTAVRDAISAARTSDA